MIETAIVWSGDSFITHLPGAPSQGDTLRFYVKGDVYTRTIRQVVWDTRLKRVELFL